MRMVSYLAPGLPEPLFRAFADVVGADLWFDDRSSGPLAGDDPFADGRADIGWLCSTSFADQSWATGPGVTLVGVAWVPDDPGAAGRPVYFGDVVAGTASPVASFEDLAGARIGCNDIVSLSGHYALHIAASDRGLDLSTAELVFTGGHQRSLDLVATGALDAAVVDSVARTRRARTDPDVARLHIVDRLGPWPVQPMVARADLDPGVVLDLRDRLLDARRSPSIRAALRHAAMVDLVPADPAAYERVGEALRRLALPA